MEHQAPNFWKVLNPFLLSLLLPHMPTPPVLVSFVRFGLFPLVKAFSSLCDVAIFVA